jgi:hypothetical protein
MRHSHSRPTSSNAEKSGSGIMGSPLHTGGEMGPSYPIFRLPNYPQAPGTRPRKLRYHLIGPISLSRKTFLPCHRRLHLSANFPQVVKWGHLTRFSGCRIIRRLQVHDPISQPLRRATHLADVAGYFIPPISWGECPRYDDYCCRCARTQSRKVRTIGIIPCSLPCCTKTASTSADNNGNRPLSGVCV